MSFTKAQIEEAKNTTPDEFFASLTPVQKIIAREMAEQAMRYAVEKDDHEVLRTREVLRTVWGGGMLSGISVTCGMLGIWIPRWPLIAPYVAASGFFCLAAQCIYQFARLKLSERRERRERSAMQDLKDYVKETT